MSTPRRHHYVPAFYLQQWATAGGKLVEFSKVRSKLIHKPVGPRATGFQADLYTLADLPPESRQHLESAFFNPIDDAGSKALNRHLSLSSEAWTLEQRNAWALCVMSMKMRHPDAAPELFSLIAQIWDETEEEFERQYQNIRAEHHPKTYQDYLKQRGPHDDAWGKTAIIKHAFKERAVRERISAMNWFVFDTARADYPLLTSDRPLLTWDLFGTDSFIAMPISPSKIFVAASGQNNIDYLHSLSPNELALRNNKLVVEQARKFVWATDISLAEFIGQHMSTRLEQLPTFPEFCQPG